MKKFDAGAEDDPQNVDRKVPSIASNNRNCPTIALVGGWKLATIPPLRSGLLESSRSQVSNKQSILYCATDPRNNLELFSQFQQLLQFGFF